MSVLFRQLDGKLPNLALMRLAAHHRDMGHEVSFRYSPTVGSVEAEMFDREARVFASLIFTKTANVARRLLEIRPDAIIGGTGWNVARKLGHFGYTTKALDYSIYPAFRHSIGFTQRGCRLSCAFCVVPEKEGAVVEEATVADIWRGDPWPRNLLLLDNDFFGQPRWRERIAEIRDGGFRVSFCQGINARMLNDEAAEALASVLYFDDDFKTRRLYTAWDNRKDEARLFAGLSALVRYGVKPDHIMVYMLVGFPAGRSIGPDDLHRQARLRDFGCRPYPMPFDRTNRELAGFARWVIGSHDKRVSWEAFKAAGYQPRNLHRDESAPLFGVGATA